eukprot:6213316-Pleurochrysis_carterae.AAC.2
MGRCRVLALFTAASLCYRMLMLMPARLMRSPVRAPRSCRCFPTPTPKRLECAPPLPPLPSIPGRMGDEVWRRRAE